MDNPFILIGWDPDDLDPGRIAAQIAAKRREWSRQATGQGPVAKRAKAALEQIKEIERQLVSRDDEQVFQELVEEAKRELQKRKREADRELNDFIALASAKGHVTEEDLKKLAEQFASHFSESEIRKRIRVDITSGTRAKKKTEEGVKPMPKSDYKRIKEDLELVGNEDLFGFLSDEATPCSRRTSSPVLRAQAQNKWEKNQRNTNKTAVVEAGSRLAGVAQDLFDDRHPNRRQEYEKALELECLSFLNKQIPFAAHDDELGPEGYDRLVRAGIKAGGSQLVVESYLTDLARKKKITLIKPAELSLEREEACLVCHELNPEGAQFCRFCASPLSIDCPRCKRKSRAEDAACGSCGFPVGDMILARGPVEAAKALVDKKDLVSARARLEVAERYWPGFEEAARVRDEIDTIEQVERRASVERGKVAENVRQLIRQGKIVAATELLNHQDTGTGVFHEFEQTVASKRREAVKLCNAATADFENGRIAGASRKLQQARALGADLPEVSRLERGMAIEAREAMRPVADLIRRQDVQSPEPRIELEQEIVNAWERNRTLLDTWLGAAKLRNRKVLARKRLARWRELEAALDSPDERRWAESWTKGGAILPEEMDVVRKNRAKIRFGSRVVAALDRFLDALKYSPFEESKLLKIWNSETALETCHAAAMPVVIHGEEVVPRDRALVARRRSAAIEKLRSALKRPSPDGDAEVLEAWESSETGHPQFEKHRSAVEEAVGRQRARLAMQQSIDPAPPIETASRASEQALVEAFRKLSAGVVNPDSVFEPGHLARIEAARNWLEALPRFNDRCGSVQSNLGAGELAAARKEMADIREDFPKHRHLDVFGQLESELQERTVALKQSKIQGELDAAVAEKRYWRAGKLLERNADLAIVPDEREDILNRYRSAVAAARRANELEKAGRKHEAVEQWALAEKQCPDRVSFPRQPRAPRRKKPRSDAKPGADSAPETMRPMDIHSSSHFWTSISCLIATVLGAAFILLAVTNSGSGQDSRLVGVWSLVETEKDEEADLTLRQLLEGEPELKEAAQTFFLNRGLKLQQQIWDVDKSGNNRPYDMVRRLCELSARAFELSARSGRGGSWELAAQSRVKEAYWLHDRGQSDEASGVFSSAASTFRLAENHYRASGDLELADQCAKLSNDTNVLSRQAREFTSGIEPASTSDK